MEVECRYIQYTYMYLCTYIHTMEVRRPLLSWIAAHWTVSCDCLHALVHSDAPLYSPEIRPLWIMSTHMHALYRPVLQLYKCPPMKGYVHVACFACTCVSVCVPRDIKQPYCLIGVGHLGGMSHVQENSHKGRGSAKGMSIPDKSWNTSVGTTCEWVACGQGSL